LELLDTAEVLENGPHALREVLNIPVLGWLESSARLARLMEASCSIVNVNPKLAHTVTENIEATGPRSRLISMDDMRIERGQVLDRAFKNAGCMIRLPDNSPRRLALALAKPRKR
jgi:Asp/Glu/hydantoin racemase